MEGAQAHEASKRRFCTLLDFKANNLKDVEWFQ